MSKPDHPVPRPGVLSLAPYQQGASAIKGRAPEAVIKLSSNESSLGPSPAAKSAYRDAAESLHRYPDGSQAELRAAIAEVHGLDAGSVVCGNGSDELIALLIRAYAGDGDEIVLSRNRFVMCDIHARAQGARVVIAEEARDRVQVDALLAAVTDRTRVVCIANPNNPTGTWLPCDEIYRLHAGLPQHVLMILDGAYAEYVSDPDFSDGCELATTTANVAVTHTFSKIYGLSALRIGWACLPAPVMDAVQRIRTPFNTNAAALAAAAAAMRDQQWISRVRDHNAQWLVRISRQLRELGLEVAPSAANFYLVRFPAASGLTAGEAQTALQRAGIIPRPMASRDDPELRITVGTGEENEAVLAVFDELAGSARARGESALG